MSDSIPLGTQNIRTDKTVVKVLSEGERISVSGKCISDIFLFDSVGRLCKDAHFNCENNIVIQTRSLRGGVYILTIKTENALIHCKLIVP